MKPINSTCKCSKSILCKKIYKHYYIKVLALNNFEILGEIGIRLFSRELRSFEEASESCSNISPFFDKSFRICNPEKGYKIPEELPSKIIMDLSLHLLAPREC